MKTAFHSFLAELDTAQLIILGLCTIMTLLSVVIYAEEVSYLFRKIRCPIKMKTLCWSSSAPTVSWVVGVLGGITLGGAGPSKVCQPTGGGNVSVPSSRVPQVVSVVSCFGLWFPRSMMVVEMATTA